MTTATDKVTSGRIALASLGGAIGSVGRYWFWQEGSGVTGELRATFVTSVVGCFVLGLILGATRTSQPLRAFAVGLCGGFASFSVYAVMGVAFATRWFAVVFLVVTPVAALGAMGLGALLAAGVRRR
ncbi:hypothetical protein GCM10007304_47450 [Rhodococcoides trifolii]|uniref:Fluoride-specific ion channel n=1 Tax=Rhodococcoides trifolii TaxID=908250 RepID=A0A917LIY0_9NOCA|nr:CrcB family protein [Rhodococcus trifolii]GGG28131.1 hypothetical protein GCM10007304_47450 [Rhodococcus trifolii]